LETRSLEGHPSETASRSATHAPAQLVALGGGSLLGILHADTLDGIGTDPLEVLGGTRGEVAQVVPREPLAVAIRAGGGGEGDFIAIIEYRGDFRRGRVEPSVALGTDFESQGSRGGETHEPIVPLTGLRSDTNSFADCSETRSICASCTQIEAHTP